MNAENRTCQNCKASFEIDASDFDFYKKIDVPPPTWCPQCRQQRRLAWRNDWHLFRKKDEISGNEIFSFIPPESPVKVMDREHWLSDAWDPFAYARDYDFS